MQNKTEKTDIIIIAVIILLIAGGILLATLSKSNTISGNTVSRDTTDASAAVSKDPDSIENKLVPTVTFDELNSPGCSVGVGTGTSAMFAVEQYLPEANEVQFPGSPVGYEALRNGTIDAFAFEHKQMQMAIDNGYHDLIKICPMAERRY